MLFMSFLISNVILGSTSSCPKNEIETECVNPCNTCELKGVCNPPPACQYGCDCKPGFFRDENGYCIPEQQCTANPKRSECPENAVFQSCAPFAIPTCENPYPEPDYYDECAPGCVCQQGYLLQKDGQCVPPDKCYPKEERLNETNPEDSKCPENAEFQSCAPFAIPTCENPQSEPDYDEECVPGCVCQQGFLLRKDGQCVAPDQCLSKEDHEKEKPEEKPKCPKNAIFIKCGSPCPPTCEDLQPKPCEEKCTTACYCKPGYLKRKDGVCVRIRDCSLPKKQKKPARKCPENAIYIKCGSPCPPTCEDRMPVCEEKCTKACYCKPGYLLKTDLAKCVKQEHCNATHVPAAAHCPVNEEHSDCVVPCNDCKSKGDCMFFECNKGCDCKKGYYRNKDGKCILEKECPKITARQYGCGSDEQFYECTPSCNNTCENLYYPDPKCQCGPPACFCKEGLFKREDGKCVPPEQCDATFPPECKADEQYYECTPSCRNTCENFANLTAKCNCGPPGCYCKEGLVKRADGKCVLPKQCHAKPQPKCGPDEQFYECGPTCNTCENIYKLDLKCQCGAPCCFCKEGLVKRKDGKCVPPEQCDVPPPPVCGETQKFYNCTPSCKNTCKNFFNPAIKCGCGPPGCFCKDGLVQREDGKCIPPNKCHAVKPIKCPANAEFSTCGHSRRPTCKDPHPPPISGPCLKGCFCKTGFVEDKNRRCVKPESCIKTKKPTKCPENAEYSTCGPTHPPTCKDPYTARLSGPCVKGCFCKSGFVEDSDGRCVRLKNCTENCLHPGEEFRECGSTCPDTCENRGRHPPGSCPYYCNRGCFCHKGLYRTKRGDCVPLEDCDQDFTTPEHDVTTTPGPTTKGEHIDASTVTVPDDCHGCPSRRKCEAYCKTFGDFIGLCIGKDRHHCRCA